MNIEDEVREAVQGRTAVTVAGVDGGAGVDPWSHDVDVRSALRAVHQRTGLSCRAATFAGLPGRFRAWEQSGVYAVLATAPALAFLSTVTGVTSQSVTQVLDLVEDPVWVGVNPAIAVPADGAGVVAQQLSAAGLVRGPERALGVLRIDGATPVVVPDAVAGSDTAVVEADDDPCFVEVLLAGYEVVGPVADYIAAEHREPEVRRFLAVHVGRSVGAAAMTVHGEIAVLGGASTLPEYRGKGLQLRLIERRVRAAADAGCELAVATVRPDSPSASNLSRAGFRVHRYATWRRTRPGDAV